VHRNGGWEVHAAALSVGVATACCDALAVWLFQGYLWLRLGVFMRFATLALAISTMALYSLGASHNAAWLAVPEFLWTLYTMFDAIFILVYNRSNPLVPNEVAAIERELTAPPSDAARPLARD